MKPEEGAEAILKLLKEHALTLVINEQQNYTLHQKHYQHFSAPEADVLVISVVPITDLPDQLKSTDFAVLKTLTV